MTIAELYHRKAMKRLRQARRATEALTKCTPDWTDGELLLEEYRELVKKINRYVRLHFNLNTKNHPSQ